MAFFHEATKNCQLKRRCFEPQSFPGSVVEPILNHGNLFIGHCGQGTLLGHILPHQTIEVFVGTALPTGKGPCKVAHALQCGIDLGVFGKLLAVVICQCFDPAGQRLQPPDDGITDQLRRLVGHFGQHHIAALALDHADHSLLVARTNDGVTLPMAHLATLFDMGWPLAQRPPVGDLSTPLLPTGVALFAQFLATQLPPKVPACGLVSIDILVHRFMADG